MGGSPAGAGPPPAPMFAACTSAPEATQRLGEALGRALRAAGADGAPALVALLGPLGAGKTCLVQGMARGLGVSGWVHSPTFTLIHEHPGPVPMFHVDLYRLSPADMDALGLEEILDAPGVTVVEWADRAGVLPDEHLRVELGFGRGETARCLRFVPRGARYARIVEAVRACESWR